MSTIDDIRGLKVKRLSQPKQHKFDSEESMEAQRRSRDITVFFLPPRRRMSMSGKRHAPATFPTGNRPGAHWAGDRVATRKCLDEC